MTLKTFSVKTVSNKSKRAWLCTVAIATIAVYGTGIAAHTSRAADIGASALSAQQVAEKSAAACRMMTDTSSTLQQTVANGYVAGVDGTRQLVWFVECTDAQHIDLSHSLWDAETGKLLCAIRVGARQTTRQSRDLSVARAADVAWQWMRTLGVASTAPSWKLTRRPTLGRHRWHVVMRSTDTTAIVVFDNSTTSLMYISVRKDGATI